MKEYTRIMYLENLGSNALAPNPKSLYSYLKNKDKGEAVSMEYFFYENITDNFNLSSIINRGVKEARLKELINKGKLKGAVGCLIVEIDRKLEESLDKSLKCSNIEKIVLPNS